MKQKLMDGGHQKPGGVSEMKSINALNLEPASNPQQARSDLEDKEKESKYSSQAVALMSFLELQS